MSALDALWDRLRYCHPDVPEVVIALATESAGRARCQQGRFLSERWRDGDTVVHELALHTTVLAGTARDVLEVMAHHAVHALAWTRAISDTSRGGAYHNGRYQQIAHELGLTTVRDDRGWLQTALTDTEVERYREQLDTLTRVLDVERGRRPSVDRDADIEKAGAPRNGHVLTCVCVPARRIRAAHSTLAVGPIVCGICRVPFTVETKEH